MAKQTTSEEGKTFTQAQLDDIIEKRLAREREKYADYDQLKEQVAELTGDKAKSDAAAKAEEDAKKSETEKVAGDLAELRKQLEEAETARQKSEAESLRLRVAAAKGLTETQANRLQGSTKEELEADADELIESFGVKTDGKPDEKPSGFSRPRESLTPGASSEDAETDLTSDEADKLADKVLESNRI